MVATATVYEAYREIRQEHPWMDATNAFRWAKSRPVDEDYGITWSGYTGGDLELTNPDEFAPFTVELTMDYDDGFWVADGLYGFFGPRPTYRMKDEQALSLSRRYRAMRDDLQRWGFPVLWDWCDAVERFSLPYSNFEWRDFPGEEVRHGYVRYYATPGGDTLGALDLWLSYRRAGCSKDVSYERAMEVVRRDFKILNEAYSRYGGDYFSLTLGARVCLSGEEVASHGVSGHDGLWAPPHTREGKQQRDYILSSLREYVECAVDEAREALPDLAKKHANLVVNFLDAMEG